MTPIKTTIKIRKPKPIIDKTFRLIDFHVCDDTVDSIDKETAQFKDIQAKAERERQFPCAKPVQTYTGPQDRQFLIRMFGINESGETVSLCITDYQPFFFVKVGDGWTNGTVDEFKMSLITKTGGKGASEIVSASLVQHHKLYGFSDFKKYNFVKITFRTVAAMNRIKNCWYKQNDSYNADARYTSTRTLSHYLFRGTPTTIYESNIPPLLRYFHIHNISPSGWIRIKTTHAKPVGDDYKTTTCDYEFICEKSAVEPLPAKETAVPYKICSFDIEASSSHGDFPLPIKTYKRLASNMVDVFIRQFQSQSLDAAKSTLLVRKIVRAAFGVGTFDDVDIVYPKTRVSLKTSETGRPGIDDLLEKLLATTVANAKTLDTTGEAANVLTIHAAFDKLRESEDKLCESEDKLRDDTAKAGGDDADENSDVEMEETPVFKKYKKTGSKVDVRTKLVDVLMSDKYSRDEKIQITDQMLTNAFPPLRGDETTFIGSTFLRYGETEPYLNNCLVVGDCDPVAGSEIVSVETERELLLAWTRLIQRENPDIIIGYNIFGFDYEFLFRRALETRCEEEFLLLSRKRGELCAKTVIPKPVQKPQEIDEDDDTESGDDSGFKRFTEFAQRSSPRNNPESLDVGLLDEPASLPEEPKKQQLDIEHTTVQLASGEYDLKYFRMSGRLQVDMYTYFRRDFNLSSYKLDDVAGQFINDEIKKIEPITDADTGEETTWLYSSNLTGLHVGDFIHIELTGFTSDYYQNGRKFKVDRIIVGHEVMEKAKDGTMKPAKYNVVVIAGHHSVGDYKSIRWGMAKDDITPQDIFRLSKGSAADRALVAKYCIQDCNLVHHLMNKIDVITGYVEMSRICSVPISFLVFRGQGIKLTSYVAKKCREKDTLMPDLDKSGSNEGYEGAIVLPPKCSMYMDNPVACVDYASLYPSSMISNNLSHDSKVWTIEYDLEGNKIKETGEKDRKTGKFVYDELPGYEYIDIEFDTYRYVRKTPTSRAEKVKSGMMVCRWAQFPEGKKGIMPAILEELLKARSDTRKFAKTVADPFMANILDKRQLAYKVTANSLYGQCGAKTSTFYEKDVAASTTATGRKMITYARRIIEEVYGDREYETTKHGVVLTKAEYVYGDTDSVFFTFNLHDPKTGDKIRGHKALEITIEIAQDAAHLCTKFLKPPMELAYEKTLMPFVLLSKKRYVGMLYETDPNKGKLKYMGLSLKRRDSCDYLKDTYGGILNVLMKENNVEKAIQFLDQSISRLIQGNVSMDKLMITKALRSDYKNPQQIAHKVLADRIGKRDPGNKPKPGDRIKFLHVVSSNAKALQGEKIETPEFIIDNKVPIDYAFYITNQLMKPLQQLFGLALEQIWENQNKTMTLRNFRKDMAALQKEFPDLEVFMKKKEKYCSQKIKTLLFDKFLTKIQNDRAGNRDITTMLFPTVKK